MIYTLSIEVYFQPVAPIHLIYCLFGAFLLPTGCTECSFAYWMFYPLPGQIQRPLCVLFIAWVNFYLPGGIYSLLGEFLLCLAAIYLLAGVSQPPCSHTHSPKSNYLALHVFLHCWLPNSPSENLSSLLVDSFCPGCFSPPLFSCFHLPVD
jgi:hypothetical protein